MSVYSVVARVECAVGEPGPFWRASGIVDCEGSCGTLNPGDEAICKGEPEGVRGTEGRSVSFDLVDHLHYEQGMRRWDVG